MKVLSVIPKTYEKDGETKTLYNIALQKGDAQIGATSFAEVKVGDEIPEDRLHEGKRPGEWVIWSEKKGGGGKQWVKNDDLIIAQVAFKGMVDLVCHDKMSAKDLGSGTCIKFAQVIKATEASLKSAPTSGAAPAPAAPPVTTKPAAKPHPAVPEQFPEPPEDDLFPPDDDTTVAPPAPTPLNLADLALVDWSKETQAYFLNTLVKVATAKKMLPPDVKKFLKEQFKIEDSRGITIAMRNKVMQELVAK